MNMIEKVARAIYETRNGKGCTPWAKRGMAHKAPYFADARAAIVAMREPTEAMEASLRDYNHWEAALAVNAWDDLISAALSEEKAE